MADAHSKSIKPLPHYEKLQTFHELLILALLWLTIGFHTNLFSFQRKRILQAFKKIFFSFLHNTCNKSLKKTKTPSFPSLPSTLLVEATKVQGWVCTHWTPLESTYNMGRQDR